MAFRATNLIPERGLLRAKNQATRLKAAADSFAITFASGGNADEIFQCLDFLRGTKTQFNQIRSIPGIVVFAAEQENDAAYDIVVEFTIMIAAIDAVIANIVATMPQDGSGFLLAYTISANGTRVPRTFSAANLSQLVADLNEISASIS